MMVFMAYLVAAIFIIAFAPSLPVLALGEALCGVAWGVFQVSLLLACHYSRILLTLSDTFYYLCL